MNRPKLSNPHRLQCIYCRQLRVCNVQMTCAGCESENAVWIEDPAGELRPLSATARSDCSGYYANEGAATRRFGAHGLSCSSLVFSPKRG